jgi:hypothetical protein
MKTKHIVLMIFCYLFIFSIIFYIFSKNASGADKESSISDVITTSKEFFVNLWNHIRGIDPNESLDNVEQKFEGIALDKHFLPAMCIFKSGFYCDKYFYNFDQNEMLFSFKNRVGSKIIVTGAIVFDGASCSVVMNETVRKNDPFYIDIQNCTISDSRAKMRVFYHDYYSTPEFEHYIEGILIIK